MPEPKTDAPQNLRLLTAEQWERLHGAPRVPAAIPEAEALEIALTWKVAKNRRTSKQRPPRRVRARRSASMEVAVLLSRVRRARERACLEDGVL